MLKKIKLKNLSFTFVALFFSPNIIFGMSVDKKYLDRYNKWLQTKQARQFQKKLQKEISKRRAKELLNPKPAAVQKTESTKASYNPRRRKTRTATKK